MLLDDGGAKPFRAIRILDPNMAFGAAARLMKDHPAFARRPFGQWANVLDGQARRGHQLFVLAPGKRLVGYYGYALASEADAVAWAAESRTLNNDQCQDGDCIIFNAWVAPNHDVHRFMLNEARVLGRHKRAAFFKRYYLDGKIRATRLPITRAVESHIQRAGRLVPDSAH